MEPKAETNIVLLIEQLKQGSEQAFNELYKLHSKILLSNIRNLVKDSEVAKEMLQDLYLKVWDNRENIDTEKSFKSFLFTVARNMVYDFFRKASMDRRVKLKLLTNAFEFYTHIEEALDFKERTQLLNTAVGMLPVQCRAVYKLNKLDGKSHQEISRQLDISISTVNNHMVKANKQVRAFVAHYGNAIVILATGLFLYR
jgi:RNA polymerase sigma-70 factor (family 1)